MEAVLDQPVTGPVGALIPPLPALLEGSPDPRKAWCSQLALKVLTRIDRLWTEDPDREWNFATGLETRTIGDLELRPLWPPPGTEVTQDHNELSTPMLVTWRGCRLLLGA